MTQHEHTTLTFTDLRNRLKAHADRPNTTEDVDIDEVLRYLTALPQSTHTAESVDALVQLARDFQYAARPTETLQAASHAARAALVLEDKLLLCAARGMEGLALVSLGRFADAAAAQIESWSLARGLNDMKRQIWAIANFGNLCSGMGQWNVALRYYSRALELAEEHGFADIEFVARNNLADCAVQLRDPVSGLQALSQLGTNQQQTRRDAGFSAGAHNTLACLHLLVGEFAAARFHAEESTRLATIARAEKTIHYSEAVLGLVDLSEGISVRGLLAVDRGLKFAKRASQSEVPDFLGICIDAYEVAGYPDKALSFLQELVAWKKKSIDAEVMLLQDEGLGESIRFQTGIGLFDAGLLAKTYTLRVDVRERVRRLVEMAVNAEMASGHDLYRTFRVAKLARCLAAAVGWDEQRIAPLALGAQLCNIGMFAIPPRLLQKPSDLSDRERHVVCDHTKYGAELLRRTKMRLLDVASVIGEQHHERYDGSGYPHGLSGAAIAEEARVVAICDAFDAMMHRRPWRAAPLSIQAALNELQRGAGSQFDPLLVKTFVDLVQSEFWQPDELDAYLAEGADELEYVRARARMEAFIRERKSI